MQPTSWKRPFKATISVDFKPTFRRVMFELTHRGQTCHSSLYPQGPLSKKRFKFGLPFADARVC
jgi:hypothetical protein